MISVGGKRYWRPSEQIAAQTMGPYDARAFVKKLAGRWMAVPARKPIFGDFVSRAYVDGLLTPHIPVSKGVTKVIDGVPVIAIVDREQTLYIATAGEPYPMRLDRTELERLSFTEFGVAFPQVKAPAATEVISAAAARK